MKQKSIFIKLAFFVILAVSFALALLAKNIFPHAYGQDDEAELLVLMYHSVLKNPARTGKYTLTPNRLEEDIIYLLENGYTSVSAKELIRYTVSGGRLPDKPVLITFDDGMYNNYEYVLPILEKHKIHAVFSIVGSYTDEYTENNITNPGYSYLRWCDVKELSNSEYVEFGNHSYSFHTISRARFGTQKNKGESTLDYINAFHKDTQKMQSAFLTNCNFHPVIYTYPFGSYSRESTRVLKKLGFPITLSCTEGINLITRNPDCLYLLKRYNRDGRLTTREFFSKL